MGADFEATTEYQLHVEESAPLQSCLKINYYNFKTLFKGGKVYSHASFIYQNQIRISCKNGKKETLNLTIFMENRLIYEPDLKVLRAVSPTATSNSSTLRAAGASA